MHPKKVYEIRAWFNTIGAVALLIAWAFLYGDHNSSPVQWCTGQVVGKHRNVGFYNLQNHGLFARNQSVYYIDVSVDGHVGSVRVLDFEYNDWSAGMACEVSFRHGRLTDYNFEQIRPAGGRPVY